MDIPRLRSFSIIPDVGSDCRYFAETAKLAASTSIRMIMDMLIEFERADSVLNTNKPPKQKGTQSGAL